MIYLTQLIYINEGKEDIFNEFESHAIPIIAKYNGELALRIRPEPSSIIQIGPMEVPYEIHLVSFNTEADFNAFMVDQQRTKYLHLKEESIRVSFLVKGEKL